MRSFLQVTRVMVGGVLGPPFVWVCFFGWESDSVANPHVIKTNASNKYVTNI